MIQLFSLVYTNVTNYPYALNTWRSSSMTPLFLPRYLYPAFHRLDFIILVDVGRPQRAYKKPSFGIYKIVGLIIFSQTVICCYPYNNPLET